MFREFEPEAGFRPLRKLVAPTSRSAVLAASKPPAAACADLQTRMSSINTTIATNTANSASPANSAVLAAFFLNFACESVELYPTNLKSTTYKSPLHGTTQPANPWNGGTPSN